MPDRRDAIAQAALAHAGCSEILRQDVYNDVVVRPVDRTPTLLPFYDRNPSLSTCALTAIGILRLAGCTEPECVSTYFPPGQQMRDAFVDVGVLARRFGAWVTSSTPVPMLRRGDIWIITDAAGGDGHMGTCTADAVVQPDGSWLVDTVEGGQLPHDEHNINVSGSNAIAAFSGKQARHFVHVGNRWMLGARFLLGYASAENMPVPDSFTPDPA